MRVSPRARESKRSLSRRSRYDTPRSRRLLANCSRICSELRADSSKRRLGCSLCSCCISANGSKLDSGTTPKRNVPTRLPRQAAASASRPSYAASTVRAQARTRSPGAVKPSKRWPRLTSCRSSSSSRLRRRMDSVGWVMWQRAAAWPKCRVSSRAIRNFSCLMSIVAPRAVQPGILARLDYACWLVDRNLAGRHRSGLSRLGVYIQGERAMSLFDTFKKILNPESSGDKPQPDSSVQAPPVEDPPASSEPLFDIYTVQSGDTLSEIARRKLGDANRWLEIAQANRETVPDPDKIKPGQQLKIPR